MNKFTNVTILVLFFTYFVQIKSSAQLYRENIIFSIERTDLRQMARQPSFYNANSNNINGFLQYLNNGSIIHENINPRSPIMLGVKLDPKLRHYYSSNVKSITKSFVSYIISDSTDAKLIALGITADNYQDYQYHVVENDSLELVPWSPILEMEQDYGADYPFANLGTFNSPGNQVLIEVVNTKNYSIRDGVIFDWRVDFTPKVNQIVVSTDRNYFNLNYAELNRGYVTESNPQSGMPINLTFPADSINNFRFYFENHETVPYEMYLKKETASGESTRRIEYWFLDKRYDFSSEHFQEPGDYKLSIQAINANGKEKKEQILYFKFQVLAPPLKEKSFSLIQFVYFSVGILLLFSLLLLFYYLVNNRKRKKINQQKQLIDLKLQSIQSQLNPHFMFNALSSIQNLMNKNDVEEANRFLGKFSKLTRKVLDSGDKDMISLEDELNILEDYLYMEQLRFNFNFEIKTDEIINKANTEVPTMLLQPLIENAVKHGVSTLNKDGIIRIHITMENNNLLLQVFDNGKGFSEELINGNSLGIKLVKERITLLNQIIEDQQIELKIESTKSGTTIVLNLNNWF